MPLGILLIVGGLLGFLPVLGFWMLPLGLALLSLDVAMLRRPTARAIVVGRATLAELPPQPSRMALAPVREPSASLRFRATRSALPPPIEDTR